MAAGTTSVAVDLLDPELWKQENDTQREEAFAYLRRETPVSWQVDREFLGIPPGPGFWSIVTAQHIREVSRDPETFSANGAMQYFDWPDSMAGYYDSIMEVDPPKHTALKDIIKPFFTPQAVRDMEEDMTRIVREVIASAAELGECDFPEHFAEQVPLRITAAMMGIPERYFESIVLNSWKYLHCFDTEVLPDGLQSIEEGCAGLATVALELGELRRQNPTGDLTSSLANAIIDDAESGERRPLTENEYVSFWLTMVTGGTETTRIAINHGMEQLTLHPDQRDLWQGDRSLTRTAIEEIIRWATPATYFRRVATRDTELGGVEIKAGDRLVLWYCSADRDEEVYDRPYEFDITRRPNPHLGFGGGGPHHCIGVAIARMELGVFFEQLFDLLPDLEISGPMERVHGFYMPDVKRMPCKFTPRRIDLDG
jgi:cytochrome P450